MPFGWGESHDSYQQMYDTNTNQPQDFDNQASLGHEVLAGGAAFAGFKAFEDHQRKEGKPVSHQFAKELLAGFAGAEVDRFAETKGEDWYDREKVKRDAQDSASQMYDQHYGQQGGDQWDPNMQPHGQMQNYGNW